MKRPQVNMDAGPVSEMAIVDTFTKLIFGEDYQYSNRELMIIQAFRTVDKRVLFDSHRDMGTYLRALGVGEMIKLVSQVQAQLMVDLQAGAGRIEPDSARESILNRRVH
ncbi:hypothetical protein [Pseudohalioglobus lutimaris]|uniref:Uncharacterized protein n=1 Tax=Pseudohalioglobus lutimaris TaxID=1737061 RepID=A0A2N5X1M7_9GAMM|nr:hypothetical protein [Pseudohalioglobus lutimaris]PLW68382.1 hypothetical protein C0039_12645 [Pseudohalioglobus lutimaris]